MSYRKRFPEGRHARPEGGWGCPRAVAIWFGRAADDLASIAEGVKELGLMAHNDRSPGRGFYKMVDDLFAGQSLFVLEHVLHAAAKVAEECHPAECAPIFAEFPPAAADEPHPWGDPDLHPIPSIHGPRRPLTLPVLSDRGLDPMIAANRAALAGKGGAR